MAHEQIQKKCRHDDDGGDYGPNAFTTHAEAPDLHKKFGRFGHGTALLKGSELFFPGDLVMWG